MNLVLHIVLKDARRMWPAVLLWALLFNAHFFSEWKIAHAAIDDAENLARLRFFEILLFVVHLLTSYVFAAAIVLEDSPAGTSMFWLTRPISGTRLLAAKIASCSLWFGVLALLLAVPWWVGGNGKNSEGILVSGGKLLLWQACVVGTGVVVAAFAGSLGRFLVWSLGAAFAAFGVMLIDRPGVLAIDALRWFAVTAIAALWLHYQLRRSRLALIALALGAVSSATIAFAFVG